MDCIAIRACTAVKRLAGTTESVRAGMGRSVRALYYCAVYCRVGVQRHPRAWMPTDAAGWSFS
jgi:hypothetical protein